MNVYSQGLGSATMASGTKVTKGGGGGGGKGQQHDDMVMMMAKGAQPETHVQQLILTCMHPRPYG